MAAPLPPLGLYVHLPWCEKKCPYCDFNSHELTASRDSALPEREYIRQLLSDLEREAAALSNRLIQTLFIGGGTPSLFSAEAIKALMSGIAQRIPLAANLEATMEANPGSAEAEKFAGFRDAGINRLSIGVQSFQDDKLAALGRIHNGEQALAAIEAARAAGFASFNIDLMHGLPGQDDASAAADLHQAMASGAPHVSWYQLTLEPNTVFHKQPPELPEENLLGDIQARGEGLLAGAGFRQYEVSAYARSGFECRHNLNYWYFGDYIGIGAGAHGKLTHADGRILRYSKTRKPADYLQAQGIAATGQRQLQESEIPGEFVMNALRLSRGFSLALFERHTGMERAVLAETVARLVERELLLEEGGIVRASALGARYLDAVVGEFFPDN
ncbi:MAG: radical SAM family heme chaperone HemW [Pseudomonadota bacterium]